MLGQVAEVLALWRESERLLEELPAGSAEHRVVTAEMVELRRLYRRLTAAQALTENALDVSSVTIERAQHALRRARERLHKG